MGAGAVGGSVAGGSDGGGVVSAGRTAHNVSFSWGRRRICPACSCGSEGGLLLSQSRHGEVRGLIGRVNSVAPLWEGAGTRGSDRVFKHFLVVKVRERPETTADTCFFPGLPVTQTEEEERSRGDRVKTVIGEIMDEGDEKGRVQGDKGDNYKGLGNWGKMRGEMGEKGAQVEEERVERGGAKRKRGGRMTAKIRLHFLSNFTITHSPLISALCNDGTLCLYHKTYIIWLDERQRNP